MAESSVHFHVESDDLLLGQHRLSICERVRNCLEEELPKASSPSVICFIDNHDYDHTKFKNGEANRGYFVAPIRGKRLLDFIPFHFIGHMIRPEPHTCDASPLYDSLIYLHGSTAITDLGLVLTLAHELCHFIQYATRRHVWAANILIEVIGEPHIRSWSDIPIEVEARYAAKQIAEQLYGEKAVCEYIEERVRRPKNQPDGEDWKYVLDLSTSSAYRAEEPTQRLVAKHKPELQRIQTLHWMEHPDVARLNLETLELTPDCTQQS